MEYPRFLEVFTVWSIRMPIVSPSKDFCEVFCLLKVKSSLYQVDFNIEPAILWIHALYKADFWCLPRILPGSTVTLILFPNFLMAFPFSLLISKGHFCRAMWRSSLI